MKSFFFLQTSNCWVFDWIYALCVQCLSNGSEKQVVFRSFEYFLFYRGLIVSWYIYSYIVVYLYWFFFLVVHIEVQCIYLSYVILSSLCTISRDICVFGSYDRLIGQKKTQYIYNNMIDWKVYALCAHKWLITLIITVLNICYTLVCKIQISIGDAVAQW